MFRNHIKIAFRQMFRNKVFTGLNTLGLALGMAMVILIAAFIKNEFSYDTWMEGSEQVYRVYRIKGNNTAWTPSPLAAKMIADFPEVDNATGWSPTGERLISYAGNDMYLENTAEVDSNFLDVLKMELKYGDAKIALQEVNSMIISDDLSERLFGDANPIGEIVKYDGQYEYMISGVLDTKNKKSHINSDVLTPFTWYGTGWGGNSRSTYTRLKYGADPEQLAQKIEEFATETIRAEWQESGINPKESDFFRWDLQPLDEVYLYSQGWTTQQEKIGSIRNVYIFGFIAFVILFVAIINYVNLTTARATQRGKEVGVKKVSGAGRFSLTSQFLTESVFQAFVAGLFALLLAEIFLPTFNHVMNRELEILPAYPALAILGTFGLALFTGFLAGIYPAFIISAFKPVKALKTNFMKLGGQGAFRKVLVTAQFSVSIILLIVMSFVYRQMNYMNQQDLGFQPDQVLTIPMNDQHSHRKVEELKSRFKQIPGVKDISTSSSVPGNFLPDWLMKMEGREENVDTYVLFSDEDFKKTMDIEIIEGRFIDDNIGTDSMHNFVVNQEFVRRYNIENPIGRKIRFSWQEEMGQIVGVMKDFHFRGLFREIDPLVMSARHWREFVSIKLSTENLPSTVNSIQELWTEVEPNYPMRYSFLDDDFEAQYSEQKRFGEAILYSTLMTVFIALLGLFGLTAFTVERRAKEIGIRKVLGSSVSGIVGLLAKDYVRLLGIAFMISIPVGYLLSSRWLEDFAYRTNIVWWVFLGAGLTILAIGFLTVCLQSIKAALVNPIKSLRSD